MYTYKNIIITNMNYTKIKKFFGFSALVAVLFVATFSFAKPQAHASVVQCDFSRNLELGVTGEDVRCLQRYLNAEGFKISESGVGSPGQESNTFGSLTKDAVMRWQTAKNFSLTTGTFGPMSKGKYLEHVASSLSSQLSNMGGTPVVSVTNTLPTPVVSTPVVTQAEKDAVTSIKEAFDVLDEAKDAAEDIDDDNDADNARDDISDAKDDLLDAFLAFVTKDFSKAKNKADDVVSSLEDIIKDVYGDKGDAEDAINDAEDAISSAEDDINEADDDGDDVHDANDLLDDARNKLDDARDAMDDNDYTKAESLAKQAENLADDAVDAIGN